MFTNVEIILPSTLELLRKLMDDERLAPFYLVGGTSLALQIGHRFSIDLNLFTNESFDNTELQSHLEDCYGFETDYRAQNTLKGVVSGVKLDFITHNYSLVDPLLKDADIRLASLKDIAAMKLNAISSNDTRYKDFIDIYFLLMHFSLTEMLEAFTLKYPKSNQVIALKGLGYLDDIDFSFDKPVMIKPITFEMVKKRLFSAIEQPLKVFQEG